MKQLITVLGSSNTDMIIRLERLPAPGETLLGGNFMKASGGKGANQAVGASRAGGEVTFVARLGQDIFGDAALAAFQKEGLRLEHITRDPKAPSGVALIFVGKTFENSIAVATGANGRLTTAQVNHARTAIRKGKVLLMQLETPLSAVIAAAKMGHTAGATVILNPAPALPLPGRLLKNLSIITPNETEAGVLTGLQVKNVASAGEAAAALLRRGVKCVIITLGSRGAYVAGMGLHELVPGFRVKPVDTTAAGDIFNGALAVALAEGKGLRDAILFANAAAAISVTRKGAQPSAPYRTEIEKLVATASRKLKSKPRKTAAPR